MPKLNKKILQQLRDIAAVIPRTYYETGGVLVLTGKQIIDNNVRTKLNVEPGKVYVKKTHKMNNPVNHYNRLKTLYRRHGEEGVKKYVDEQIEFHNRPKLDLEKLVKPIQI